MNLISRGKKSTVWRYQGSYLVVAFLGEVISCRGRKGLDFRKMAATRRLQKENPPYNKGAFRIEIAFPAEYPFKPPKVVFKTKIYHPNIDEKGQVCLPIITPENWKPATKTEQVVGALIALINDPEPEHPLRADLAEEYTKDKKKFMKNAEEHTKKLSEKRPAD